MMEQPPNATPEWQFLTGKRVSAGGGALRKLDHQARFDRLTISDSHSRIDASAA
jgi:hypothetical protein